MNVSKQSSRAPLARMMQVHERLQTCHRTNCRTLASELEVSARTIQRDIDFMRDRLGLPIAYDETTHGFYYSREVVQFPTMKISEGELIALSVARKALVQYRGTPFEKPLRDAFDKLTSGLREQIQFAWNSDLDSSISFRASGHSVGDLSTFDTASQAVQRNEELEFSYQKLSSDLTELRLVQPLHLACIDNQWYLFGCDLGRGGSIRTFVLTRMKALRNTGHSFTRPPGFSLDEHLADSFGAFSSPEAQQVRVRFDAFSARLIREREWHASQQIEVAADGSLELSMHVGVSPEVERWVLGWGAHAEVLEPASLRASVARVALQMTEQYTELKVAAA